VPRFVADNQGVLCDESGHTKFPSSYLAHVTLLTLAQARLRIGSGLAQDLLRLAQAKNQRCAQGK